jgi:hypothetical protein
MSRLMTLTFLLVTCAACERLPPARSPEEALFRKRCGNCHNLPSPEEYSAKDWQRIVPQMSVYARLSQSEESQILGWLVTQRLGKKP